MDSPAAHGADPGGGGILGPEKYESAGSNLKGHAVDLPPIGCTLGNQEIIWINQKVSKKLQNYKTN